MTTLREELTNDPLGIGYAGMSNGEIEVSLNAKTRTKLQAFECGTGTVLETLGITDGNGLLDIIKNTPDFRYVWPLLEQGRLRLDSALVRSTLNALAAANAISQASADALNALALVPCSRGEELGLTINDIEVRAAKE
jgi:hypothetical protein